MNNEDTAFKPGPVEWKPMAVESRPQLDRLLHFHTTPGSLDIALKAKHIRHFQRHPENKIRVIIVTDLMGPQGPIGYEVEEGFDWCVELYTAALENRPINVLMDPQRRHPIGGIIKS